VANLILPDHIRTKKADRGRDLALRIITETANLVAKGKTPTKIIISTACKDDWAANFGYVAEWDGKFPKEFCGVPIEWEPGAMPLRIEYTNENPDKEQINYIHQWAN
jgi:hypothetical protein